MSSDDFLNERWLKKLDRQGQELAARIGVDRKTFGEVFDTKTLLRLGKLISNNIIEQVDFPISTGKEANVFRAVTPEKKFVALKIYRTSTLTFKHIQRYIDGDPRFKHLGRSHQEIINEWAKKEFKNLHRLHQAHVLAPKPIKRLHNIVIMDYLGNETEAAPMLKDVTLSNPKKIFQIILMYITRMYNADLVHADLSAYNILMFQDKPYLIDVGQSVVLEHPSAYEFLQRDIHNIVSFFKKYGIIADEKKIYEQLVGKEKTT